MEYLNHAHYFPMPSQGNVNTIAFLHLVNGTYKILVASLKRQVFCLEYTENPKSELIPSTKEVSFTYIPTSAEIISIDAFNKSQDRNDFVIGITIIKNSNDLNTLVTYLNIYSEYEDDETFDIESVAQNCLNVQLTFIPHYHGHTELVEWDGDEFKCRETVFLLTGSDGKFHVFREDTESHTYQAGNVDDFFPEFCKPPGVVTWLEVRYFNNYAERLSVFGTENGHLRLCRTSVKTRTILFSHSTHFISYISHVRIYQENQSVEMPSFLKDSPAPKRNGKDEGQGPVFNLIVANTSLPSVFFHDCLNYGLDKYMTLRRCDLISVTSCIEVADLDLDGKEEVLLGNSKQEILLYKFDANDGEWRIHETKNVVSPIFRIKYLDLSVDGGRELVVFTMKGVYIFQHDNEYLQRKLEEKARRLGGARTVY